MNDASGAVDPTDVDAVLALFDRICDLAAAALAVNDDWSTSAGRPAQYTVDREVDRICVESLHGAGFAVLSEESGISVPSGRPDESGASAREPLRHVVVVDPLDGSTNAALGLPWCATALCLVSDGTPTVATVANLRTGARYAAVAGRGAWLDGRPLRVDAVVPALADAIVAVNARPSADFRPRQFRAMGATALDICSVAAGGFDATADFDSDRLGVWDYLAAVLVLREAGGFAADRLGRELVVLDAGARRSPVTASSRGLLDELIGPDSP